MLNCEAEYENKQEKLALSRPVPYDQRDCTRRQYEEFKGETSRHTALCASRWQSANLSSLRASFGLCATLVPLGRGEVQEDRDSDTVRTSKPARSPDYAMHSDAMQRYSNPCAGPGEPPVLLGMCIYIYIYVCTCVCIPGHMYLRSFAFTIE